MIGARSVRSGITKYLNRLPCDLGLTALDKHISCLFLLLLAFTYFVEVSSNPEIGTFLILFEVACLQKKNLSLLEGIILVLQGGYGTVWQLSRCLSQWNGPPRPPKPQKALARQKKTYATTTEGKSFGKRFWPQKELSRPNRYKAL